SIYYINKNMPKTIYYEAKISERIKKNKKQNHNIHIYYLKYQKPINNIYYLKDYTQLFTTKIQQTNKIYTNNFIDMLLLQSQLIKDE
ncbi:hypothetical protein U2057_15365, partial [Listeria monocytogenes]|uniref:hypothetical protein n=1 Tax=Listeria monocytogenes TaxID=1639 RepID=UPI002FDBC5B4